MGNFLTENFMDTKVIITSDPIRISNLIGNVAAGACSLTKVTKGVVIIPNITKEDTLKTKIMYLVPSNYLVKYPDIF